MVAEETIVECLKDMELALPFQHKTRIPLEQVLSLRAETLAS